jgi:hypothetical protein
MIIEEQDIFNAVFNNEILDETQNEEFENYNSIISVQEFYENLKDEVENIIEIEERDKLVNSIPDYKYERVVLID